MDGDHLPLKRRPFIKARDPHPKVAQTPRAARRLADAVTLDQLIGVHGLNEPNGRCLLRRLPFPA